MLHNSFCIHSPFVLHSPSPTFSPFSHLAPSVSMRVSRQDMKCMWIQFPFFSCHVEVEPLWNTNKQSSTFPITFSLWAAETWYIRSGMCFGNTSLFFQHKANLFQENSFAISFLVCDQTVRKGGNKIQSSTATSFYNGATFSTDALFNTASLKDKHLQEWKQKDLRECTPAHMWHAKHKSTNCKRNALNKKQSKYQNDKAGP